MAYTINVHGAGQSLPHAVPHVAGVQPDGLVDDLQPDAVAVLPLRLTLEGDVLLLPPEHIVLEESYTHLIIQGTNLCREPWTEQRLYFNMITILKNLAAD